MNPHTSTPERPSSLQWQVGKKSNPWTRLLLLYLILLIVAFIVVIAGQRATTRRAVHACNAGHLACRVAMGHTKELVNAEDKGEDQTVCGDGWRECMDAAGEGNIE